MIRGELKIVRTDSRLVLIRVIKTLDVVQVADVQSSDVIGKSQGKVCEAAVLRNVGAVDELGTRICDTGARSRLTR